MQPVGLTLALRYTTFALFSTGINLLVQAIVLNLYQGDFHLIVAMAFGTIAGLVPKYLLDNRWIFADQSNDHAKKFTLYTAMSVVTTLIFWAFESLFDRLGHGGRLHYLGAVIGLAIGYWTKYQLDRRFVFRPES